MCGSKSVRPLVRSGAMTIAEIAWWRVNTDLVAQGDPAPLPSVASAGPRYGGPGA